MTGLILDALSIDDIRELAVKAENSNFHSVWATELYRTSFQQLSAAASVTEKIKLGSAVSLAFTRSPLITSLSALDLDEFSGGRLILGLGSGAKNTNKKYHGVDYGKPVRRISECVDIIRHFISTSDDANDLSYNGEYYNIDTKGYKRPFKRLRDKIPIYMAGIGEKMVEATARIADGYIGHVVCNQNYLKNCVIPAINKGLKEGKRNKSDFDVASIITCAVSDDYQKALYAAKATIGFYATVRTYRKPFELAGFAEEADKIRDAYFKKDIKGMINNVPDEMAESFAVVGDEKYCRKKIDEYRDLVDIPILSAPHYFIDFNEVKEYQDNIIQIFGK